MEEPDAMPWVRLDDSLLTDDRFLSMTDGQRAGYIAVLLAGARRSPPGTWTSSTTLDASLPRWADPSTIDAMIATGLLVEDGDVVRVSDPSIYGPLTATERQAGWRRRRNARVDVDVDGSVDTPSLSSTSTSGDDATSRAGAHEALPDGWTDIAFLTEQLTGRPYALPPYGKLSDMVVRMLAKHGLDRLRSAMTAAAEQAGDMPTPGQVIIGASNALDAIPRVRGDCGTCLGMGVTSKGRRPCPDCGRSEPDPATRAN